MSEALGPVVYTSSDSDEVFLGRDLGHSRNYSEEIASRIDEEVHTILMDGYKGTEEKLSAHMDQLRRVAEALIEKEKLDGEEFRAIMEGQDTVVAQQNDELPKAEDTPNE